MAYGIHHHTHNNNNNNDSEYNCNNHSNITDLDHALSSSPTVRPISSINSQASRFHSRSQSWSHTSWMQTHNNSNVNSSSTMASIFSPMRVIQGIVPTLTDAVTGSSSNRVSPPAPLQSSHSRNSSIVMGSDLPTDTRSNSTHVRTRSDVSIRHSRNSSAVEIDLSDNDVGQQQSAPAAAPAASSPQDNTNGNNGMEFLGTITWMEKALPFALLLLSRIMWDHRIGILVFIGLFGTFFHVNSTIRKQVALKERRLNRISLGIFLFLFANTYFIYFVFNSHHLHMSLVLQKPNFKRMDLWTMFWCVGITDFVVKFITMALKCVFIIMPKQIVNFRRRGKFFLIIEQLSQFYRMVLPIPQWYFYFAADFDVGGEYFAVLSTAVYIFLKFRMLFYQGKEVIAAVNCFWKDTRYGRAPSKEVLTELGDSCPICQEEMSDPIELSICKHIFCEECIVMWFDRERTCPMCRAKVAEDPQWRDGSTQIFIQLF